MTYKELYESAIDKLEKSKITIGEFEKMIEPLNAEIDTDPDTISRQAAIDAMAELQGSTSSKGILKGISKSLKRIKQLPPAQPAQPEIIRCKDCKHWIPYDWMFSEVWQSKNMADYPEDEIGCNYCDMAMKANDFCSRGERRGVTDGNHN